MTADVWDGPLAGLPFSLLLFRLWERRDSGSLRIQGEEGARSLCLLKGDLALADGFFSEEGFLRRLLSAQALTPVQAENCAGYARENKVPYPRALIELTILPPSRVWELLFDFWMEELFPVFDWQKADYSFDPKDLVEDARIFALTSTLSFILRGVRRMKNYDLIASSLPADTEPLQVLFPSHADLVHLTPHERYVLGLLQHNPRFGDLFGLSLVGKRESQKVLFALLSLGFAGPPQPKNRTKSSPELSSAGLEKIWSEFNDKCAFIYKYISKEIGPVASSVLEKALDEVRARLGPPLHGLELRTDGRVEFKPFPLMSLNLFTEETRKNFVRVLNEILMTEILAVKKTLGNSHEAAVVKSLEKIGEPN
ncbi:MAG: DUF4388 domain-containing protein [Acidobacteriota bacterium]